MAVRILSNDLVNPDLKACILSQDEAQKRLMPASEINRGNSGVTGLAGALQITGIPAPGIMALDIRWHTGNEEILMRDEVPSQNINIQFQVSGNIEARFRGLNHALNMEPGRHNLIFAPEPGDETRICRHTEVEMLHISIDRCYFASLVGAESAWCERVLRELEAERPFSGIHGTGAMTPAMTQLVQGIRHPAAGEAGPVRRMQTQARLLELLSLQFGQFVANGLSAGAGKPVSADDAERLHRLKDFLDRNFLEEHSLAQLAQRFLLNEFKLKAGFRRLFGASVFGYLKELRMNHAALLLRECRLAVEEVAYTLGYEHAHHFSAAFKKHFGYTPGQWRQRA